SVFRSMPRTMYGSFIGRVRLSQENCTHRRTRPSPSVVLRLLPFLNSTQPGTSSGIGVVLAKATIGRIRTTGSPSITRETSGSAATAVDRRAAVETTKDKWEEEGSMTTWS